MNKKILVYIAGPYTYPDPAKNTLNAIAAADALISVSDRLIPIIPHLSHYWHKVTPRPVEWWYDYDNEILKRCDVVLRIPGMSRGADNEVDLAKKLEMPVYFEIEHLMADNLLGWL